MNNQRQDDKQDSHETSNNGRRLNTRIKRQQPSKKKIATHNEADKHGASSENKCLGNNSNLKHHAATHKTQTFESQNTSFVPTEICFRKTSTRKAQASSGNSDHNHSNSDSNDGSESSSSSGSSGCSSGSSGSEDSDSEDPESGDLLYAQGEYSSASHQQNAMQDLMNWKTAVSSILRTSILALNTTDSFPAMSKFESYKSIHTLKHSRRVPLCLQQSHDSSTSANVIRSHQVEQRSTPACNHQASSECLDETKSTSISVGTAVVESVSNGLHCNMDNTAASLSRKTIQSSLQTRSCKKSTENEEYRKRLSQNINSRNIEELKRVSQNHSSHHGRDHRSRYHDRDLCDDNRHYDRHGACEIGRRKDGNRNCSRYRLSPRERRSGSPNSERFGRRERSSIDHAVQDMLSDDGFNNKGERKLSTRRKRDGSASLHYRDASPAYRREKRSPSYHYPRDKRKEEQHSSWHHGDDRNEKPNSRGSDNRHRGEVTTAPVSRLPRGSGSTFVKESRETSPRRQQRTNSKKRKDTVKIASSSSFNQTDHSLNSNIMIRSGDKRNDPELIEQAQQNHSCKIGDVFPKCKKSKHSEEVPTEEEHLDGFRREMAVTLMPSKNISSISIVKSQPDDYTVSSHIQNLPIEEGNMACITNNNLAPASVPIDAIEEIKVDTRVATNTINNDQNCGSNLASLQGYDGFKSSGTVSSVASVSRDNTDTPTSRPGSAATPELLPADSPLSVFSSRNSRGASISPTKRPLGQRNIGFPDMRQLATERLSLIEKGRQFKHRYNDEKNMTGLVSLCKSVLYFLCAMDPKYPQSNIGPNFDEQTRKLVLFARDVFRKAKQHNLISVCTCALSIVDTLRYERNKSNIRTVTNQMINQFQTYLSSQHHTHKRDSVRGTAVKSSAMVNNTGRTSDFATVKTASSQEGTDTVKLSAVQAEKLLHVLELDLARADAQENLRIAQIEAQSSDDDDCIKSTIASLGELAVILRDLSGTVEKILTALDTIATGDSAYNSGSNSNS